MKTAKRKKLIMVLETLGSLLVKCGGPGGTMGPCPAGKRGSEPSEGIQRAIRHHTATGGPDASHPKNLASNRDRLEMYDWVRSGSVSDSVHRILSFKSEDAAFAFVQPGNQFEAGKSGLVASWSKDNGRAPLSPGAAYVRVSTEGPVTGRDVEKHSIYKEEQEVLTPRNSKFEVISSEYKNTMWYVKVRQVGHPEDIAQGLRKIVARGDDD